MIVDEATVRVAAHAVKSVQAVLGIEDASPSSIPILAGGYAILTVVMSDAEHQLRTASTLTPGTWIRVQHFSRLRRSPSSPLHNLIGEKSAINILPPFCWY